MERSELSELHYIAPIANLRSIMTLGLLSHHRARPLDPVSVAMQDVQDKRARKRVPGGMPLHDYVNLFICARNPMLFKRLDRRHEICVLRVSTTVLDMDGVVITDMNAASDYVRFHPSPTGLAYVNRDMVFADDWRYPADPVAYYRHSAVKCAEVLVPHELGVEQIVGAYVCSQQPLQAVDDLQLSLGVTVDRHLFFDRA